MSQLSIYIHWPFCEAKCPYCDFNSHVRKSINQEEWTKSYISSLKYWAQKFPKSKINSIFFGGGTPSLMSDRAINEILSTIYKHWSIPSDIEISLEANPTSSESKKFKSYSASGINRLSLGVQALNDKDLKKLGRLHTAKEARNAFDIASCNFNRVSFDLIYGRQYQTLKNWESELLDAIKMTMGHLSLYQLTIEDNTRFGQLFSKGKLRGLPEDVSSVEFFNLTQKVCEANDLHAYEISNHCKKGQECKHNLTYWRGKPFLGVGPGAHGRVDINKKRYMTEAPSNPELWLNQVQNFEFKNFKFEQISHTAHAEEYIMMSLRLKEGMNINHYTNLAKDELPNDKVKQLIIEKLITLENNILKTTKTGKLLTNYIIRQLLC